MAELNKLTVEMWQYNHSGTAWRGDLTVMSNHKKLKQLSCKAPPGDHLCRITFIQAFSKADPPQKVFKIFQCFRKFPKLFIAFSPFSSFFPLRICRPSPTPPAGPTFYVDLATPDSTVKETMEGANIQVNQTFKYFWPPSYLLTSYLNYLNYNLLTTHFQISSARPSSWRASDLPGW